MQSMFLFHKILILLFGVAISLQAVPPVLNYAGQVAVNGEAFDGNGLFKFALVNTDGTATYWSNDGTSVDGAEPQASVAVPVNGGLYSILLGNTAQQGMGAIDPAVFAQHTDAKLRVWFSDGVNGFQQLSPDRPFASVPYAFSAGTAQTAGSAAIAKGAVNLDMLSQDVKTQINATIGLDRLSPEIISKLEQNATITNGSVIGSKMADGAVTASKIAKDSVGIWQLNPEVMKYLKPEITVQPQAQTVYEDTNVSYSVTAEGKYLTYQWKKDGVDLTGETNATLNITDANATLHDGNYSVLVSNDFGSVESDLTEVLVKDAILNGLVGWWKFDEGSGTVAYDSSGNGNDGNLTNGPTWTDGQIGGALSFDGVDDYVTMGDRTGEARFHNSVSYWFRAYQFNNAEMISKSSPAQGLEILFYNGGLKFFLMTGDVSENKVISFSTGNLNLNQWYHVTAVQFGQGGLPMHFYINGELVGSDVTPETISDADKLYVGRWNADGRLYNGLIDDVRTYDRALSAEEVQAIYNLGQ
jgi:hypothetical protein